MLQDRVAIVTGSTSGIGLGIARALAAEGASVMLNGFGDTAEIEQLRVAMSAEFGVSVAVSDADMSKPEQVRGMVRHAAETFGGVDILVNNAGIQHVAPVEDFPDDRWDAIVAINLSDERHHLQRHLPGLGADAARAAADRRSRRAGSVVRTGGARPASCGEAAVDGIRDTGADRRTHRVHVLRRRLADARRVHSRGRRVARAIARRSWLRHDRP